MKKIVLVGVNAKYTHTNPAIRYLAHYAGHPGIELFECTINQPVEQIAQELAAKDAALYGFSSYIWNIEYIRALAKAVPGIVLLGGPEASSAPEEYLGFADYIIRGEGEEAFRIFVDKLERGEDLRQTPSLCYLQDGQYRQNPPAPYVDLGSLPIPYENLQEFSGRVLYYESSRGCPFRCAYCLSSLSGGVRFAPVSKVLADLDRFVAAGVMKVKFVDRTFNANPARAREIFAHIIQRGGDTDFHFEIAADLLDEQTCALLERARPGQIQLEIGVQSTHQPTLAAIKRVQDFGYTSKMVRRLAKAKNLHLHLDLIAGLPLEGMEQFCCSIDDVMALGAEKVQLGFLKVLKGSKMQEMAGQYGILYSASAPYEVCQTAQLSGQELAELHKVEYLLERTYNSGLFRHVVDYFGRQMGYANFYLQLSRQMEQEGISPKALGEKQMAEALLRFCQKGGEQMAQEMLRLDLLIKKRRPKLPAALECDAPWKRELFRENSRMLQNLPAGKRAWHYARLEDFSLDLCRYIREGEICPGPGRYLFDYTDWSLHDLQTGQETGFGNALPVLPRWEA